MAIESPNRVNSPDYDLDAIFFGIDTSSIRGFTTNTESVPATVQIEKVIPETTATQFIGTIADGDFEF